MQFDFEKIPATDRYKIMISTIVPRPIAWITTVDAAGVPNAAPYSFFNAMGIDPPIIIVGVQSHPDKRFKDTGQNILASTEFVVNLVNEANADAMNITCIDAPAGVDELKLAKLETAPSVKVKPPRIVASPVSFECTIHTSLTFSPHQAVVIGRIVHAHIDDAYVLNKDKCYLDTAKMHLVGRMHGAGTYTKTNEQFVLDRPEWADWVKQGKV